MEKELFSNANNSNQWMKRKDIKKVLAKRLHHKRRPSAKDLEDRGIVPQGYFTNLIKGELKASNASDQMDSKAAMVVAIRGRHSRKLTAEKQIRGFLGQRKDPKEMLAKGLMSPEQYANITGDTSVLVGNNSNEMDIKDEENDAMHEMNQMNGMGFGGMGVAAIIGRQMMHREEKQKQSRSKAEKESELKESGISGIVKDYNNENERNENNTNIRNEWLSHEMFESVLSNLEFVTLKSQILAKMEYLNRNENNDNNKGGMNSLYQLLERLEKSEKEFGYRIGRLLSEKRVILDSIQSYKVIFESNMEILNGLMKDHIEIENRIRPQMKLAYQKMTAIEEIVNKKLSNDEKKKLKAKLNNTSENTNNNSNGSESGHGAAFDLMVNDLIYYEKYCFELNNMFITMDSIRKEYKLKIHNAISELNKLEKDLKLISNAIKGDSNEMKNIIHKLNEEFHSILRRYKITDNAIDYELKRNESSDNEALVSNNFNQFEHFLNKKENKLESQFKLLEFSMQKKYNNSADYSRKLIELSHLSFIYNNSNDNNINNNSIHNNNENEKLKLFFEYYIKIAIQYFNEMQFAYYCFKNNKNNNNNREENDNRISKLKSIKYLAEITPAEDYGNEKTFESLLFGELEYFVNYLNLISFDSNNDNNNTSNSNENDNNNNNVNKYESVIFHVSRFLSAIVYTREILKRDDLDIAPFANGMVLQWIYHIMKCFEMENSNNNNNNSNINDSNNGTPMGPDSGQNDSNSYGLITGMNNNSKSNNSKHSRKDRNLVIDCKNDSMAQLSPSHAAAMVVDYVYNVRVVG